MSKKITNKNLFILIIFILFGSIGLAKTLNIWEKTEDLNIEKYDTIDEYNPEGIKGSFSFQKISDLFNIPTKDLLIAFKYPEDTNPEIVFGKNFEDRFMPYTDENQEIGNGSIKQFVAIYKDLPYEKDPTAFFPKEAYEVLSNVRNLNDEDKEYLKNHILSIDEKYIEAYSFESEETTEEDFSIKGQTTFKVLLDKGISKEEIEKTLGLKINKDNEVIKDFCERNDLNFSETKTNLQNLLK